MNIFLKFGLDALKAISYKIDPLWHLKVTPCDQRLRELHLFRNPHYTSQCLPAALLKFQLLFFELLPLLLTSNTDMQ